MTVKVLHFLNIKKSTNLRFVSLLSIFYILKFSQLFIFDLKLIKQELLFFIALIALYFKYIIIITQYFGQRILTEFNLNDWNSFINYCLQWAFSIVLLIIDGVISRETDSLTNARYAVENFLNHHFVFSFKTELTTSERIRIIIRIDKQ